MYVDDLNIGETQDLATAKKHITTGKEERRVHARFCEKKFAAISKNSEDIGMKINGAKTQLLCITDNNAALTKSYININNEETIMSNNSMKILGFTFGATPSVGYHVDAMIMKFRKSLWTLNHLKYANMCNDVILNVYCVMLRPILEYCCAVYHPLLTKEMSNNINRAP